MEKVCFDCGKLFWPTQGKLKRCIGCHYLMKQPKAVVAEAKRKLEEQKIVLKKRYLSRFSIALRRRYTYIKASAKKRGLPFELSPEHLLSLLKQPCYYCGIKEYWFSVDRLDNNEGYSDFNTVAACHSCNSRKNQHTAEWFKAAGQYMN